MSRVLQLCVLCFVLVGGMREATAQTTEPSPPATTKTPPPTTPSKDAQSTSKTTPPKKTAQQPVPAAPSQQPAPAQPAVRANPTKKTHPEEADDQRFRFRDDSPDRSNEIQERYRRRSYRYRRARRFSGPYWQRPRFFWGVEAGYAMFHYRNYKLGASPPYQFNSFLLGGRFGFAAQKIIFTGDIYYGFGGADGQKEGGFLAHLGITLAVLPVSYLSIDFGTGLQMITSFDITQTSPALVFPLEAGVTIRIPWRAVSLGLRLIGSISFGMEGIGLGFRSVIVLGAT